MLSKYLRKLDTVSLSNQINLKLNLSDTSSMLTNYLRTNEVAPLNVPLNTSSTMNANLSINGNLTLLTGGILTTPLLSAGTIIKQGGTTSQFLKANGDVDSNTYLTTSSASSTYLPLTGGILSGNLFGINQGLSSNLTISDIIPENSAPIFTTITTGPSSSTTVRFGLNQSLSGDANMFMGGTQGLGGNPTNPNIYFTDSRKAYASIGGIHTSGGTNNQSGHIIFTTTPSLNTVALTERMRIAQDGSITMGGTLGVTGATTLTGALTVNNATVLNEGSGDFDTRIESDGNANMVFVDASTDRGGIGTSSPSKTLDVNGEVKIATVTATPTSLLGKDGSNVVGEVTTVAQTGLMTRGETTATTGSPSAIFTVTHLLGSNPSSVIVTSAGIGGAEKIIFEVYSKSSTTFSVQAWNLDGTEAASKSVKIYWLAIK
jgi:hypothetical protein